MSMSLSAKVLDELRGRHASRKRTAEVSKRDGYDRIARSAQKDADDTFRQMQIVAAQIIGRGAA